MLFKLRLGVVVLCSFFLLLGVAFGQKASIEADVKGADGRPPKTAEVRIEQMNKKGAPMIAKTDRRGHLAVTNLEVGTYKLTAVIDGRLQSPQIVKTQANKPSVVTFDLRKTAAAADTKKKYYWVPSQTGSNFGGHWVEVGQSDQAAAPGAQSVDSVNANAMDNMQRQSRSQPPMAGGGR
jgi:hypothetical protein